MGRNHVEVSADDEVLETVAIREHEKDVRASRRSGKSRDKRKSGWGDEDEDDGWN